MATTSPDNIWSPDAGDDYALVTDLAAMADTIQDALTDIHHYRIGSTAARTAFEAQAAVGDLFYDTNDTAVYAWNGATWDTVWVKDTGWSTITTFGSNWSANSLHPPEIKRVGKQVFLRGAVNRTTTAGALAHILTIPSGYRIPANTNRFLGTVVSSGGQAVELVFRDTNVANLAMASNDDYATNPLGSGVVLPVNVSWWID